jgi:hypothetical protein
MELFAAPAPLRAKHPEEIAMPSFEAVQRRLDTRFDQAQDNLDDIALNAEGYSLDDMHSFVEAMRQVSAASYAVNQETVIKHNLAKAIVDAMP